MCLHDCCGCAEDFETRQKVYKASLRNDCAAHGERQKKKKKALCAGQHRKQMPTALNLNEHTLDQAERE